jgi:Ser-tRNA(Ala) deacylase AlaX
LSPDPLPPGTHVRQAVSLARRWDDMQQHAGQHLLSAIMDTYDNLETLGWGMGEISYVESHLMIHNNNFELPHKRNARKRSQTSLPSTLQQAKLK